MSKYRNEKKMLLELVERCKSLTAGNSKTPEKKKKILEQQVVEG